MTPTTTLSASLALAAALAVLLPGPANADLRTHSDAAGDVRYFDNTDASNVPPPVAAPTRTIGDITTVQVTNGTSTVKVVAYFRSLPRAGQFHGHVFRFVSGSFERKAQITAGPDTRHGWTGDLEMFTTADKPVTCRGTTHLIDYAHRRVILNVPRSCLRNPAFVKVGFGTVMLAKDKTYFDDAFKTGGDLGGAALKPTLGPTVAR